MSYRPYPNADRALRQVRRHQPAPTPTELQLRMARQARAALDAAAESLRPLVASIPALSDRARTVDHVHP